MTLSRTSAPGSVVLVIRGLQDLDFQSCPHCRLIALSSHSEIVELCWQPALIVVVWELSSSPAIDALEIVHQEGRTPVVTACELEKRLRSKKLPTNCQPNMHCLSNSRKQNFKHIVHRIVLRNDGKESRAHCETKDLVVHIVYDIVCT